MQEEPSSIRARDFLLSFFLSLARMKRGQKKALVTLDCPHPYLPSSAFFFFLPQSDGLLSLRCPLLLLLLPLDAVLASFVAAFVACVSPPPNQAMRTKIASRDLGNRRVPLSPPLSLSLFEYIMLLALQLSGGGGGMLPLPPHLPLRDR